MYILLLGQVCYGLIVTGAALCWTDCYWSRFVMDRLLLGQVCDRLLLGQVCDGQIFTGAGL